jgi:type II secretory pathway component GspD/PulD (secretin)
VPDSRIQAIIVTAPKDLMDQIAGIMTELDVTSDRDQNVAVIPLENGDPQQVAQVLQSMFGSGTTSRGSGSSANSALMQRQQSTTTSMGTTTTSTGIGSTGSGGGGRGGGGF